MNKPFLISIPKSGTHLMRHILEMDRKKSKVIDIDFGLFNWQYRKYKNGSSGHIIYWPGAIEKIGNFIKIFLIRDLRDIIVSWSHFKSERANWFKIFYLNGEIIYLDDYQDKIMILLRVLHNRFIAMAGWMNESIVIRYEGLLENPEKELRPVAKALDKDLDYLVERSKFRGGRTFRKGLIGEWENEFTEEHINYFNARYEGIMRFYGYE